MNTFILITLWLAFPVLVFSRAVFSVRRLREEQLHDQLLYRFCHVRDAMSAKAIAGELHEDSELFRFFYEKNAALIHHHKDAGLCFHKFAKDILGKIDRKKNQPLSAETKRLFRQISHADESTRKIIAVWLEAATKMMEVAAHGTRFQRAIWRLRNRVKSRSKDFHRWLGRQHFVSIEKRANRG